MAFTDVLGDYLSARMDRATQPFTDPEAYLRQRLLDEEEERKKREREEAARVAAEQSQAQQRAVEQAQQPQAQQAAPGQSVAQIPPGIASPNPYGSAIAQGGTTEGPAPSMGGPVAPDQDQANIEEQRRLQQAAQAQQVQQIQPAPAPAVPQQPEQPMAAAPGQPPAMTMEERIAAAAQRAQQRAAATQQPQQQPTAVAQPEPAAAPAPAPAVAPAVPAIPESAAQTVPAVPALPQFGPGVQVASTEPGAGVAQAAAAAQPAPAPATAEPAWIAASNEAGNDFAKLLDVAAKFPEARGAIQEKLKSIVENQRKADEAQKIVQAAQAGDIKAMNKLEQSLRPTRGKEREEVTVGDYLKAYMYARLGLNELSQQVQQKIAGSDTKFGQVQIGNTTWSVETNAKTGEIIRAKDDEGNIATPSTLNKLAAAGMKTGGQVFGFTGESATIPAGQPDAGQEYRQRTNSQSGAIENIITTGPNAGKIYSGPPGLAKRVETSAAVKLNDAFIDFQTKPTIAMATTMLELAGKADKGDGRTIAATMDRIRSQSPAIFNKIQPLANEITGTVVPVESTTKTTAVSTGGGGTTAVKPTPVKPTPVGGGGGGSLLQQTTQQVESVKTAEELKREELKPGAQARGKIEAKDINNQNYADSTYGIIKPISDAIKKSTGSGVGAGVDKLAGTIGVGTQGAENIAKLEVLGYQLLSNVPRFEGPQSDLDVAMYKQAAGDLSNSNKPINVRLAALDSIVMMLKKYDKAGNNDWSFGQGSNIKIIKREKVQ